MQSTEELLETLKEINFRISGGRFSGFSDESINFFNDYPEDPSHAKEWWISLGSNLEHGIYHNHLKPEFHALIVDLIEIISTVDAGIQTDVKQCVSRPNSQGSRRRYIPYYWGAIHYAKGETSKKSMEIQFFINLTKMGLRVGIYVGKQKKDDGQWSGFDKRLRKRSEEVYKELILLVDEKGFDFVRTNDQDHAKGSIGTKLSVTNSDDLINHVLDYTGEKKEFTLLKTISKERLFSRDLIQEILTIFVETRRIYEILESSGKMKKIRRLRTE